MEGFILLHRSILDWEWYKNKNTLIVFIYLLLRANHKQGSWQGITIERGQVLTSIENISKNNDVTFQQARTALNHLKKTNELTIKVTNKFSLITISKYDIYNSKKKETNKQEHKQNPHQSTLNQQPNNKPSTTNNNVNNDNNDNNVNKGIKVDRRFYGLVLSKYFLFQSKNKDIIIKDKEEYQETTTLFCQNLLGAGYDLNMIVNDFDLIFQNYDKLTSFLKQKTFNIREFAKYYSEICDNIKTKISKKCKNNFDKANYIKNTLENIINS
jgi:hypothetical protein